MGPLSIGGNFAFLVWFGQVLMMMFHLRGHVETREYHPSTRREFFAYLSTLPK